MAKLKKYYKFVVNILCYYKIYQLKKTEKMFLLGNVRCYFCLDNLIKIEIKYTNTCNNFYK